MCLLRCLQALISVVKLLWLSTRGGNAQYIISITLTLLITTEPNFDFLQKSQSQQPLPRTSKILGQTRLQNGDYPSRQEVWHETIQEALDPCNHHQSHNWNPPSCHFDPCGASHLRFVGLWPNRPISYEESRNQTGTLVSMNGNAIMWGSWRQDTVSLSITGAWILSFMTDNEAGMKSCKTWGRESGWYHDDNDLLGNKRNIGRLDNWDLTLFCL